MIPFHFLAPARLSALVPLLTGLVCRAVAQDYSAQTPLPPGLPSPLVMADGSPVTSAEQWRTKRRPELLELFTREMYGRAPGRPATMTFRMVERDPRALNGRATRQQVKVFFSADTNGPHMDLLLYVPNGTKGPVPAFLGINFWGNHAISTDPGIRLASGWMESNRNPWVNLSCVTNNRATEACRGLNAKQWSVERILERGYAVATFYRGDIAPDFPNGMTNGVHALHPELQGRGDNFGTIGAWAWALSRALDCLETNDAIDAKRVAVLGWSRLGKTALWAAAQDERFALTISIQSGAGGVKLFRRGVGESIRRLNTVFPHWYAANFRQYSDRDKELPFDQHEVIALHAPRPVYVASAAQDTGADPEGEFLGLKATEPVYRLLGVGGLPANQWPATNAPIQAHLGYHVRPGGHDVTDYDWTQFLEFADRHLGAPPEISRRR